MQSHQLSWYIYVDFSPSNISLFEEQFNIAYGNKYQAVLSQVDLATDKLHTFLEFLPLLENLATAEDVETLQFMAAEALRYTCIVERSMKLDLEAPNLYRSNASNLPEMSLLYDGYTDCKMELMTQQRNITIYYNLFKDTVSTVSAATTTENSLSSVDLDSCWVLLDTLLNYREGIRGCFMQYPNLLTQVVEWHRATKLEPETNHMKNSSFQLDIYVSRFLWIILHLCRVITINTNISDPCSPGLRGISKYHGNSMTAQVNVREPSAIK